MPFMGKKDVPFMGKEDSKDEKAKARDEQNRKDRKAVAEAAPKQSASKSKQPSQSKGKDTPPEELKGEELDKAAKKADVEGRSQMTAEEKRQAVAEKSGPQENLRQTAVDPGRSEEKERERAKVAEERAKDEPTTSGYQDRRSIVDDAPSRTETRPLSVADQAKVKDSKSKKAKDEPPEAKTVDNVDIELGDAHLVLIVDKARFRLEPAQVAYLTKGLVHANNNLHVHSDA